ncbi:MAG: Gfo/Idh/MocA family oxidoreductase [Clostridia bacterium]|nr:Gfo/Idh/MocA family oxidoreductase [Clostridia bacterium]
MKICIIGGSGHYRYTLKQLKNHTLIGIAPGTPDEDLSKLRASLQDADLSFKEVEDYRSLLDEAEVAVVNTQFNLNAAITMECLERGIHVFSEKPLATDLEQLARLRESAARSKALVAAMFGINYTPWFLTVKEAIKKIGTIRLINAQKSYRLGTRPAFFNSKKTFGGLIPWVAIHAISWIHDLTDAKAIRTSAMVNNEYNFGHGDLEMTALCQFELEGGILASVTADYFRPNGAPTKDDDRVRVVGTKGIVECIGNTVTLIDEETATQLPLLPAADVFELFLRRIGGEEVGVSPEESFYITELALKADQLATK